MQKTLSTCLRDAAIALSLAISSIHGANLLAQSAPSPYLDSGLTTPTGSIVKSRAVGLDVLTDTQGVDFAPYFRNVIQTLSYDARSAKATPASATSPSTLLSVTIDHDGQVIALHLDESSHNGDLDRAAWRSVTQLKSFPPLPNDFTGSRLSIRVRIQAS